MRKAKSTATKMIFLPATKAKRSEKVCIFYGMMDYLAYKALQKSDFVRLASDCDIIVMTDSKNIVHAMVEGDEYQSIYLYLPNDVVGSTIAQTMVQRHGEYAVVCNPLYKGYANLLEFAKEIERSTQRR